MHRLLLRQFAIGILAATLPVVAAACNNENTPTTPTPPPTVTDPFSGTINRNGAATHTFTVATAGDVKATLKSLAPDSTIVVGLSLGTWNGAACQIVIANDKAAQGNTVTGTASSLGTFCVRVYDVGNIVDTTSYEIEVEHP